MSEQEIANNVAVLAGALAADNTTPAMRQAAAAAFQALVTQLLIDIHRIADAAIASSLHK